MIEKMYDEFFGTGYWEKQYKQQIIIFAEKCIVEYQKTAHNSDYAKCKISVSCKKCDHNVSTNPCHIICDLD